MDSKEMELDFIGRTYSAMLYVVVTLFVSLLLAGFFEKIEMFWTLLGLWAIALSGFAVHFYFKDGYIKLGMQKPSRSVPKFALIILFFTGAFIIIIGQKYPEIYSMVLYLGSVISIFIGISVFYRMFQYIKKLERKLEKVSEKSE